MNDTDTYKELAAEYLRKKNYFEELLRTTRIKADGYWGCLEQKRVEIEGLIKQRGDLLDACKRSQQRLLELGQEESCFTISILAQAIAEAEKGKE